MFKVVIVLKFSLNYLEMKFKITFKTLLFLMLFIKLVGNNRAQGIYNFFWRNFFLSLFYAILKEINSEETTASSGTESDAFEEDSTTETSYTESDDNEDTNIKPEEQK